MKAIRAFHFMQFAVVSAIAIGCTSETASAQAPAYKFRLPYEAHWGMVTLPAGNYSVTIDGIGTSARIHIHSGAKTLADIAAQSYDLKSSEKFAVTVVRSSSGNFVRDVTVPELGEVFHFPVKTKGRSSQEELAHLPSANGTK